MNWYVVLKTIIIMETRLFNLYILKGMFHSKQGHRGELTFVPVLIKELVYIETDVNRKIMNEKQLY